MSVTLKDIAEELVVIRKTFMKDYTVESRLRGVGILTKEQAHNLGTAGPFARASGITRASQHARHRAGDNAARARNRSAARIPQKPRRELPENRALDDLRHRYPRYLQPRFLPYI